MSGVSTRFMLAVWDAVVRVNLPSTPSEYRRHAGIAKLCRENHGELSSALDGLVDRQFLTRCYAHNPQLTVYWFGVGCKLPPGRSAPTVITEVKGMAVAAPRTFTNAGMPNETPRGPAPAPQRPPSRMGNRLIYADGRITDLDGNLILGVPA